MNSERQSLIDSRGSFGERKISGALKGVKKSVVDLKLSFLKSSFERMTALGLYSFSNFIEMHDRCNFCVPVPIVYFPCTWVAPFYAFNKFLTYKKIQTSFK